MRIRSRVVGAASAILIIVHTVAFAQTPSAESCAILARQQLPGHADHDRRGYPHRIVHAGRIDERHWQPPALLSRRGSHRANTRIADRLRGLVAARQLEQMSLLATC